MEEQIIKAAENAIWDKASAMAQFATELIRLKPEDAVAITEALAETMKSNNQLTS